MGWRRGGGGSYRVMGGIGRCGEGGRRGRPGSENRRGKHGRGKTGGSITCYFCCPSRVSQEISNMARGGPCSFGFKRTAGGRGVGEKMTEGGKGERNVIGVVTHWSESCPCFTTVEVRMFSEKSWADWTSKTEYRFRPVLPADGTGDL